MEFGKIETKVCVHDLGILSFLGINLIEMRLLLIEVLCMQIKVKKLEEIEYLGVPFSAGLGLNESSVFDKP